MLHKGNLKVYFLKHDITALAGVTQWTEHRTVNQRVTGSISQSGHLPELQAKSPCGARKSQLHMDVSLPLFLSPFPSLKISK